jgi:hypothetical protein
LKVLVWTHDFFFFSTAAQTQGLMHARQAVYH